MIPKHCRHMSYPERIGGSRVSPTHCKAGVCFADVELPGVSIIDGRPCLKRGRDNGATCESFAPWTGQEIAEHETEVAATCNAINRGECTCGAKLERAGTAFRCPRGCVSGFSCGSAT